MMYPSDRKAIAERARTTYGWGRVRLLTKMTMTRRQGSSGSGLLPTEHADNRDEIDGSWWYIVMRSLARIQVRFINVYPDGSEQRQSVVMEQGGKWSP